MGNALLLASKCKKSSYGTTAITSRKSCYRWIAEKLCTFLKPGEVEINNRVATKMNGEPLAFSMNEMGSGLSDNYSYLDMSAEELSAKGEGGLRMMHHYSTIKQNDSIATPPDDYVPNKVGNVDISKLQAQRNKDIIHKK